MSLTSHVQHYSKQIWIISKLHTTWESASSCKITHSGPLCKLNLDQWESLYRTEVVLFCIMIINKEYIFFTFKV